MKLLTVKQVLFRIVVIFLLVESLIMLSFAVIPHELSAYPMAFIDGAFLALLSTPLIYIWVIKPFVFARDAALAQLEDMAHTDPLTKLANRRLLLKYLERNISGSVRHKLYGGLLLIDLDEFKPINDIHGHEAGDAVLVEIAKRLQSITRSEDVAARMGGDEFVLLINRLDTDERIAREKVLQVVDKLFNVVNEPIDFNGKTLHIGATIGIRLLGFEELDAETAIREADIAMYDAKRKGKGCAVFYEE